MVFKFFIRQKSSTLALPEHELGELIALLRGTLAPWIIGVLNKPCRPRCSQLGHGTDSSEWQQPNVDLVEPV